MVSPLPNYDFNNYNYYMVNYGIYAIIALLIVNVICMAIYMCNRKKNNKKTIRYNKVSPESDTDC